MHKDLAQAKSILGFPHLQQEGRFQFQFSAQLSCTEASHSNVVCYPTSYFGNLLWVEFQYSLKINYSKK